MRIIFTKSMIPGIGILLLSWHSVSAQTFLNPIPIPPTVSGSTITISVDSSTHNFNPMGGADSTNVSVKTYCYNSPGAVAAPTNPPGPTVMEYLAPTQIWTKNAPIQINVTNHLNCQATSHWHGANLPSEDDGGPQEIMNSNGGTFNPAFTVRDSTQTHWYHSHLMEHTTEQVAMGLAGMIIVNDPADPYYSLVPHDYGQNDFPIIIQEKGFFMNGSTMEIDTGQTAGTNHPANQFYTPINGVIAGYLKVPQQVVRLRILNGSLRKSYQFGVSDSLVNPQSFYPMSLMATDGGYVDAVLPYDSALIAPGERQEFLIDFSGFTNGDVLYLSNLERGINGSIISGSGPGGAATTGTQGNAFMAFIVDNTILPADPISSIPSSLSPYTVDTSNIFIHRNKVLMRVPNAGGGVWLIDSTAYDMMTINDTLLVNKKEMWSIYNITNAAHPFHIHKTEFQVARIDSISNVPPFNIISSISVPTHMMGYKDVVLVMPNWKLTFVANFDSFPNNGIDLDSAFMYHCHILTHEDMAMMHQFIVVDQATWDLLYTKTEVKTEMGPFALFPNPSYGEVYMKGASALAGKIRYIDLLGRTLREEMISPFDGTLTLNTEGLPKGLYQLEWTAGDNRFATKILLK